MRGMVQGFYMSNWCISLEYDWSLGKGKGIAVPRVTQEDPHKLYHECGN